MGLSASSAIRPSAIRPSAFVLCLVAGLAGVTPQADADVIYLREGTVPATEEVEGWIAMGGEVKRPVPQKEGPDKQVTFFGMRGRIVDRTPLEGGDHLVHFQVLLAKKSTLPRRGTKWGDAKQVLYTYHPEILQIPRRQIRDIEEDFDSLHDLRSLLGNDDIRLRELAIRDPRVLADVFGKLKPAEVVRRVSRGDDSVYAVLGYGGVFRRSLLTYRLGLRGSEWKGLKDSTGTRYDPGWLTYLIRFGAPRNTAERKKALKAAQARGEPFPSVARIPLYGTFDRPAPGTPGGPAPMRGPPREYGSQRGSLGGPAPPEGPVVAGPTPKRASLGPSDEILLGASVGPVLHRLMIGAARDSKFVGIALNGPNPTSKSKTERQRKRGPLFKDAVVGIMRELTSWSKLTDRPRSSESQLAKNARARAVGRVARRVVVDCLDAASSGRRSPFDVLINLRVGTTTAAPDQILGEEYLPVDPSWLALIAMEVIQGNPDWQKPESDEEARRLVRTLIRLARPRYPNKDKEWKADPRSRDFGRKFVVNPDKKKDDDDETRLHQEVLITLGGAARGGLLIPKKVRGKWKPSPYLRPMIGLVDELEHRDRVVLLEAMAMAGVGDEALYTSVVERMFAICLDNEGWEDEASPRWVRRARRDAVSSLGLLVRLEEDLAIRIREEAGGAAGKRSYRVGGGNVARMIYAKLDRLLDAKNKKTATDSELRMITMIKEMAEGAGKPDLRAAWLPPIARSRELAKDLTNGYHEHVKNSEGAAKFEGSRAVERMKANLEEEAKVNSEIERIKARVEDAKERLSQFPFPRPKD